MLQPGYSAVHPSEINLHTRLTRTIALNIPLISAAMDTVTEYRTAISMAQEGGIGIVHKNMSIAEQAQQVDLVKRSESGMITNPITIAPEAPLGDALKLMRHFRISGVPVTRQGELMGILTNRDLRFAEDESQPVSCYMTSGRDRLITVQRGISLEESKAVLHRHRIEKLLVVDEHYALAGMITVKDIEKARRFPLATKDAQGRLRVGAAVGPSADLLERAEALARTGVDLFVMDTAHAHSERVLRSLRALREAFPKVSLIGGNIVTAEAAEALVRVGVDAIKVGIGPGSICTTRIVAGVGMPQLSAIQKVASVACKYDLPVISDGGIKFSGDLVKALAAGAESVMVGNLFAGTEESPGQVVLYHGRRYKVYRGMGSLSAMANGSTDRYFESAGAQHKHTPEGVEGRVPYRGALSESLRQYVGGLRSGMGYVGAENLEVLRAKSRFVRVTSAGLRESHVHDIQVTDEAPNYPSHP